MPLVRSNDDDDDDERTKDSEGLTGGLWPDRSFTTHTGPGVCRTITRLPEYLFLRTFLLLHPRLGRILKVGSMSGSGTDRQRAVQLRICVSTMPRELER